MQSENGFQKVQIIKVCKPGLHGCEEKDRTSVRLGGYLPDE